VFSPARLALMFVVSVDLLGQGLVFPMINHGSLFQLSAPRCI